MDIWDQILSSPSPLNISLTIKVFISAPHSSFLNPYTPSQYLHCGLTRFSASFLIYIINFLGYPVTVRSTLYSTFSLFVILCNRWNMLSRTMVSSFDILQMETIYEMKNNLLIVSSMKVLTIIIIIFVYKN